MGLADLENVDLVTGEPDGDQGLWILSEDWTPEREALDHVQLLIKLAHVRAYAEGLDGQGHRWTILLHSGGEPPSSVLRFLRERDIAAMTVGPSGPRPAAGRPARFPNLHDGSPDLDSLQAANAASFAAEHGLDGSLDSLVLLDDALEERRRLHGLLPGDVDPDFSDGDLIVLAGAYAGEVLRHHTREAMWWLGPPGRSGPLHMRAGLGLGSRVDTLGRVRRYLQYGSDDSVHALVADLAARLGH
ncbi:hypothetical protein Airi02_080750 [Actinoallomurus iriomotensis]|uniref:Uncharacterized protein n=1 Tax=Actinoallomurus iriomotensis TaxID=478107 RepID=A0A9W6S7W0_9ACTN|nr:hypothetical protein Airi02_080750 [Actinoallomurus iriomotensis]